MYSFGYERDAISIVFNDKKHILAFVLLALIITSIYIILLPSLPNGTVSLTFVRFATPFQIVFSIIFGVLLGLIIVLNLYTRKVQKTSKSKNISNGTVTGAIAATFVNLLCCTPIIPSIIALFGGSTPLLFNLSAPLEAFFENNYVYFYLISAVLLVVSVHYISKNASCCVLRKGEKRGN